MPKYDEHYKKVFAEWLDNSDPKNLGIVKWAKYFIPEYVRNETPDLHVELYLMLLELYNPFYRNKYERLRNLISWRGSGKSAVTNAILGMYIAGNNGRTMKILTGYKLWYDDDNNLHIEGGEVVKAKIKENFICIVSETGSMAEEFTVRIRDEFAVNKRLRSYYKIQIENAYDDVTGKWTRSAFKMNDCFFLGVGAKMQIRGRIRGAYRVTMLLADDIYSENNTITDTSRRAIERWWDDAVKNSVDDLEGKIWLSGTIVHEDTVLVKNKFNPVWKTIERSLMPIDRFNEFVEEHLDINWDTNVCMRPFDDIKNEHERISKQRRYFDDLQKSKNWGLSWADRIDLYYIAIKFKEQVSNGTTSGFYQEYFHQTIPPDQKRFRKEYFQTIPSIQYQYKYGYSWIREDSNDKWTVCYTYFGIDLASGQGADKAAIDIIAVTPDSRIYVLKVISGKFIYRDDMIDDRGEDIRYNKVISDRSKIAKIGVIDETFRQAMVYRPREIKVGVAGEEKGIAYQFEQVFRANKAYTVAIRKRMQTVQQGRKEERILNGCIGYYETRMVYHVGALNTLEYQLEYLSKTVNDDEADALEVAFYDIEIPPDVDVGFFEDTAEKESVYHRRDYGANNTFDWRVN